MDVLFQRLELKMILVLGLLLRKHAVSFLP